MARTGTEILIEKLIKMLGLDPQIILSHIDGIRKSVSNASGDIAAIRRDQELIMLHLGITSEPNATEQLNGQARIGDDGRSGNA